MSVSEFERHQLFSWFEEHMGRERAITMMNLVPPTGWGDVATRRDLQLVEARIDVLDSTLNARIDVLDSTLNARIDALDSTLNARIDALDSGLNARIDALDGTLNARVDALEARLDAKLEARLGEFRSDLLRTFGTWLFASQAVVIAAVSVLIALG